MNHLLDAVFDGRVVVVVVVVVVVPLLQGGVWGAVYTVYSMGAPLRVKKVIEFWKTGFIEAKECACLLVVVE